MTTSADNPTASADNPTAKTRAVVTGASAGIGAATVRRLISDGWSVLAVARRQERLDALRAETGCDLLAADITSADDVARIVEAAGECSVLINNAGGARGTETVENADFDKWRWMYESNVIGTSRLTKAMLPVLRRNQSATVLIVSSVAGLYVYEGGAGYTTAKHAETAVAGTLRLELSGEPIRVIEIDPGLVNTEEFTLRRLGGDAAATEKVYEGIEGPLVADDIANCIAFAVQVPAHVNIDRLVVRPVAQSAQHKMHRGPLQMRG